MLRIEASEGYLLINVEIPIPAAQGGQWSDARLEHLGANISRLITDTVEAAEMVDDATRQINATSIVMPALPASGSGKMEPLQ